MKKALNRHLEELYNSIKIDEDSLNTFVEKFKSFGNIGVNSNSLFYVLNLHSFKYEYVNNTCDSFTGFKTSAFYKEGMNLLPKFIIEDDFKILSHTLFPKMNKVTKKLTEQEVRNVVFELYYKMRHQLTNKITQVVEYSSYSKFDVTGQPVVSTGVCYESPNTINGVRGIVRINYDNEQLIIFDETITTKSTRLTKTEKEVARLLTSGSSRKDIAAEKNVSLHTVNTHVKNLYRKMDVNKVSELIKLL